MSTLGRAVTSVAVHRRLHEVIPGTTAIRCRPGCPVGGHVVPAADRVLGRGGLDRAQERPQLPSSGRRPSSPSIQLDCVGPGVSRPCDASAQGHVADPGTSTPALHERSASPTPRSGRVSRIAPLRGNRDRTGHTGHPPAPQALELWRPRVGFGLRRRAAKMTASREARARGQHGP